jgi:uncharacterized membrane protein YhhN
VTLGVVNIGLLLTDASVAFTVTKALLMPVLLAWLLVYTRGHLTGPLRLLTLGLLFAWAGDVLLEGDGDLFFIAGLLAFLAMQVCYILAFTRVPGPGLVRAWKIALVPFVAVWLALNILVSPGALRVPVLLYSVVLVAMAVAALDLVIRVPQDKGWRVAIGAALFVVSDGLIALTAFGPLATSTGASITIMTTYIAAQGLITTGFTAALVPEPATR